MKSIVRICVFVLNFSLCLSDGNFVSRDEFNELKRIVDEGKIKYDELNRKYRIMEEMLQDVLIELKKTKSHSLNKDQGSPEASTTFENPEMFKEEEHHHNTTGSKNRIDMTENVSFQNTKTKIKESRQPSRISVRSISSQQVAFFVREVADNSDLGIHQTIIFKNVITNIGNDYNPFTGVFTCSQPGVYVFFLGTELFPEKTLHTAIVKNGEDISYNFAGGPHDYHKASTMAIVGLNVGDSIWVRVIYYGQSGKVLSDPENYFSGFLLYQNSVQLK